MKLVKIYQDLLNEDLNYYHATTNGAESDEFEVGAEVSEETLIEDYPSSFNIEEFKALTSFNARIKYCEANLVRISSGSGRIVYKVDENKVLKLAKNKKGVAQNEVEEEYSNYDDLKYLVAEVFNTHSQSLWIEMELARKVTISNFKQITGYNWEDFMNAVTYEEARISSNSRNAPTLRGISQELLDTMYNDSDGLPFEIFNFVGSYNVLVGDLMKKNSYGVVKRDGVDTIILIDYGLTNEVYDGYYN